LVQTDFNGDFEAFAPIALSCVIKGRDVISIYPNPATNELNISMNISNSNKGTIAIYNSQGQVVKTILVEPVKGQNTYTLDVSSMAAGQYFVHFGMENENYPVQKLMIAQ